MNRYSPERKAAILKKLLPPLNMSVAFAHTRARAILLPALFEDIYSRKAVGADVYEQESGELAAGLLQRIVMTEQCRCCIQAMAHR